MTNYVKQIVEAIQDFYALKAQHPINIKVSNVVYTAVELEFEGDNYYSKNYLTLHHHGMSILQIPVYNSYTYNGLRIGLEAADGHMVYYSLTDPNFEPFRPDICECGSEKCGLPTHSFWCKKYKPF